MKLLSLMLALTLLPLLSWSQRYSTAAGLRLGTDWGITIKQRLGGRLTFEGIAQSSLQREELLLTGLLERHMPILGRRLNIYFGGGMHKGWLHTPPLEPGPSPADPFGVTLVGGAELTIGRINVGYDFKPAINIQGGAKRFYSQSGLSVRYVLIKDTKSKKKRRREKERRKKQRQRDKKQRQRQGGGLFKSGV